MTKNYATVNPCSMCMPLGSVMAFRGIENTMPFFHGSQGCSTYMRLHLSHHFKEPIDIASSALSENGAVYGGGANLKQGLRNVIKGYDPRIIGIATTCIAETIGEDLPQLIKEFKQEYPGHSDVILIPVSTPSFKHSHEEGYNETLRAVVQTLAKKDQPSDRFNLVIAAIVSPEDVRYLKQMFNDCGWNNILLPDTSETFDAPVVDEPPKIPVGGTQIEDIKDTANSKETVTIGSCSKITGAGAYLECNFNIPHTVLHLPIGLEYSDMFVSKIEMITGTALSRKYELERGRLLDAMIDSHKYVAQVKTAVFGDTDIVIGVTKLLTELGMDPQVIATGSDNQVFEEAARKLAPDAEVLYNTDFTGIHSEIKKKDIELMIGPFTGRQISKAQHIPLIRLGFPNHDRMGASRQLILGYEGAMRLIDTITNTILENK